MSRKEEKVDPMQNEKTENRIGPAGTQEKTPGIFLLFFAISAFVLLFVASRSSYLYPYNTWCDVNSYFTVGKSLFNGLMPYRDVFDQKGMYLYFFYGLAYLVSHTTLIGGFWLEVIAGFFDIWGSYRILRLFTSKKTALILSPVSFAVTVSAYCFLYGGSAEELMLPFLIWGLYLVLEYAQRTDRERAVLMPVKTLILGGVLAGMIANLKFNSLGFFFFWMAWVFFSFLREKKWLEGFKACGWFLLGMALPFVPWFFYFLIRGGLYYWYWGTIDINVFSYSNLGDEGIGIGQRIYELAKQFYWLIRQNTVAFVLIIMGTAWAMLRKGQRLWNRLLVPGLLGFLFLGIYVGGSSIAYYAVPLMIFTVMGVAAAGCLIERYLKGSLTVENAEQADPCEEKVQTDFCRRRFYYGIPVVSLLLCLLLVWMTSMNVPYRNTEKEDIYLYRFAPIVAQTKDPTLLNVGCLDAGLYTVCDILPTCQWFQTQTVNSDTPYETQYRWIEEQKVDYVICRNEYVPDNLWEKYELVSQADWEEMGYTYTYYLFRVKR